MRNYYDPASTLEAAKLMVSVAERYRGNNNFEYDLVDIVHRAIARVDGAVVGDVVAVVALRRRVERRDPEIADAEVLQVVEALRDAREIAPAVPVRVLERLRINLIDDFVMK